MNYPIEIFRKLTDKELHRVMTEVYEFNHGVNRNKEWIVSRLYREVEKEFKVDSFSYTIGLVYEEAANRWYKSNNCRPIKICDKNGGIREI